MAYDEDLADRIRGVLPPDGRPAVEKRMFGGLAFMRSGRMVVAAVSGGALMLRVDPSQTDEHVRHAGVTRFEMRGRPMDGWVLVEPSAVRSDDDLRRWVAIGVAYVDGLPPKT